MAAQINTQVNGDLSSSFFWETKGTCFFFQLCWFAQKKTHDTGYDIGVCECWKDLPTCLAVWCCVPCTFGYIAGQVDGRGFSLPACFCPHLYVYRLRREVQEKFGIQEHADASMCGTAICPICTAVQDIHEVGRAHPRTGIMFIFILFGPMQLEKRDAIKFLGGAHSQPIVQQPTA